MGIPRQVRGSGKRNRRRDSRNEGRGLDVRLDDCRVILMRLSQRVVKFLCGRSDRRQARGGGRIRPPPSTREEIPWDDLGFHSTREA